jgi:predicted deacylase
MMPHVNGRRLRQVETNLNLIFGTSDKETIESRRADQILAIAKHFDVVIDVHGHEANFNYVQYGPRASGLVRGIASALGFQQSMIGCRGMITEALPKALTFEAGRQPVDE